MAKINSDDQKDHIWEIESLKRQVKKLKKENIKITEQLINFQDIYDKSTIGIYKTAPDGKIIYANDSLIKMLKFNDIKELQQRNLEEFTLIDENSRNRYKHVLKRLGRVEGFESIWFDKDGDKLYVKETARSVKDADGNIIHYIGTVENISVQKEKEKELKAFETRYRSMNDFMPIGIVIHKNGYLIYANDYTVKTIGVNNKEELIGQYVYNYVHKDYHELARARIKTATEKRIIAEPIEQIFVKQNGEPFYVEVTTTKYSDDKNTVLTIFRDITKRIENQKNVQLAKDTYKNIINSLSEAVFIHDKEGKFIDVNDTVCKIFGYSRKELLNTDQERLIDPETNGYEKSVQLVKSAFAGKTNVARFIAQTKSGDKFPVEVSLTSTEYFDQKVVVAIMRDITRQKQAEEKIIESEKKYRDLIDLAVGGILIGCPKGFITEVNSHACTLFGRTKDELVGKHISEGFFTAESLKKAPLDFESLHKGKTVINQREIIKPNGDIIWIEMHTKQLPNKSYQSIYHDISERKKAQEELLKSKRQTEKISKKQESLLKAIPDIMFTFDKNGNFIDYYTNRPDELFIPPNMFFNKNITEVLPEDLAQTAIKTIRKVLITKQVESFDYDLMQNGEKRYFDGRMVYVDKNSVMSVVRDITERYKLIEELRIAKTKAEESHKLISAFLGNLSHEVRTPMNGILGFAELLKDKNLTDSEKVSFTENIEMSGKQLIAILDDIIEISKIDSGVINLNRENFSVNEMLHTVETIMSGTITQNKKIKLMLDNKIELDNTYLFEDKVKLQQILTNIIDNAIKFTEKGQIKFGIFDFKNEKLTFYVKDQGIGIPDDYQEIIFESFMQIPDKSNFRPKGSGLGLAICKAFTQLMDGEIYLDSKIGKGTTFYVTIPVKREK